MHRRAQFEVVVIRAGPAGMAAGCLAAEVGRRVAIPDHLPWPGGQTWRGEQARSKRSLAQRWLRRLLVLT